MKLIVEDIHFSYGSLEVLKGVGFETDKGIISLLGPNGAGKSTLVKCLSGALHPNSGKAEFNGHDLFSKNKSDVRIAYMSQEQPHVTNMSVLEIMLLGRLEKLSIKVSDEDIDHAYKALEILNIEDLASKQMNELSGGQSQMVMIAQCLVSEPEILILDEPMNNLDLRRELEMFDVIGRITKEKDLTTIMVLHDINFASHYSDTIAMLKSGTVYGIGTPEELITEQTVRDVYGVEVILRKDSINRPMIEPLRSVFHSLKRDK